MVISTAFTAWEAVCEHPLRPVPCPRIFSSLLFGTLASPALTDKLEITSKPSGATVEIDGIPVGTTPFEKDFPGGYFHKARTVFGSRLKHPLVVRVSLVGFATKEVQITDGPMNWIDYHGRHHGEYWLLKTNTFHTDLEPISDVFTGSVTWSGVGGALAEPVHELSMEEVIARTKPAVVYLKGLEKAGTGFFVSDTGVIATNAHVARGEGIAADTAPRRFTTGSENRLIRSAVAYGVGLIATGWVVC